MSDISDAVSLDAVPSGTGCADCDAASPQGWWVHLRRCAQCGHVGCCDSSPNRHATAHALPSQHPIIRSLEPGEGWCWCYEDEIAFRVDLEETGV
jgi:hypothetical protein